MFEHMENGRMHGLFEELVFHACECCGNNYEDEILMLHGIGFNPMEIQSILLERGYDEEEGDALLFTCRTIASCHSKPVPEWVGNIGIDPRNDGRYDVYVLGDERIHIKFEITEDMDYISNDDEWYWVDQFASKLWKDYGEHYGKK